MNNENQTSSVKAVVRRLAGRAVGFRSNEGGAMLIFGLFIFVIMMVAGGMAVDFMRFERERARLAYTADRAALAAGALSQPIDAETVVADYFTKAGLGEYDLHVDTEGGINYKLVEVSARTEMNTFFINLLGTPSMMASAQSGTEERRQKIELSLVLDFSNSMNNDGSDGNTKIQELRTASTNFLNTVLANENDMFSVNIIPYNQQVNVGAEILDQLNVSNQHNESNCVDFEDDDFDDVAITKTQSLRRTDHFDPFMWTMDHPRSTTDNDSDRLFMCSTDPNFEVVVNSQDREALKTRIDSIVADGNTSIDIGVKWGAYFLDPSSRPILNNATSTLGLDDVFDSRPVDYGDADTIKILVVMTDGVNTTEYRLDDDYGDETSNLYFHTDSTWMSVRNGSDNYYNVKPYRTDGDFSNSVYKSSTDYRLSWREAWEHMGVGYYAYYMQYMQTRRASTYYGFLDNVFDSIDGSKKNDRLKAACDAAKAKDIVIYTIGFEVTDASALIMQDCATSTGDEDDEGSSNFFRVDGNGLGDAFNQIAKTIQRLKLTS